MNSKISIVGAGLVGCLWALLLKKRGFEVEVFEKRSDLRSTAVAAGRSINLIITSRGMHALDKAGLLEKALELSVPVYGRMIHPIQGSIAYQPYGQENERNLSISRFELNKFLLDSAARAGVQFHFNHDLEDIDLKKKKLFFRLEDERRAFDYNLVFGTDGAGSVLRKKMSLLNPQIYNETVDWLDADYKELFIPTGNSLDNKALHIWPRGSHMMMALANLDKSFTVTLYLPKKGPYQFSNLQDSAHIETFFQKEFPDAMALIPNYKTDFLTHPVGSLGTVRFSRWIYEDSVALLGDAAHAIVPFFGQGMNSGFEDCTYLLELMDSEKSWGVILNKFNQNRIPNANAIADMAIENWIEMSEKVADPKFLLRKKVESLLEKKFPGLFKSRYGMVTYTLMPYSIIQKAGLIQNELLGKLCANISTAEDIDLKEAEIFLKETYQPFIRGQTIS